METYRAVGEGGYIRPLPNCWTRAGGEATQTGPQLITMRAQDPKLVRIRRQCPRWSSPEVLPTLRVAPGAAGQVFRHASAVDGRRRVREAAAVAGAGLVGFGGRGARVRAGVPSLRWALGRWVVPWLSGLDKDDDGLVGSVFRLVVSQARRVREGVVVVEEEEKVEKGREEGLGSAGTVAREVCPLLAMDSEHSTDADRGLGRRRAGEGGVRGWWMVGRGPGCSELPAYGWGRQDESYPPQLKPMGFWERLLMMASTSFCRSPALDVQIWAAVRWLSFLLSPDGRTSFEHEHEHGRTHERRTEQDGGADIMAAERLTQCPRPDAVLSLDEAM